MSETIETLTAAGVDTERATSYFVHSVYSRAAARFLESCSRQLAHRRSLSSSMDQWVSPPTGAFRAELVLTGCPIFETPGSFMPRQTEERVSLFIPPLTDKKVRDSVVSLQKWEGYVLDVSKTSFNARLIDLTERGTEEDAEFDLSEVSQDDLQLVAGGAVFYWSIGYLSDPTGRRRTVSEIRFRRLPAVTPEEYAKALTAAKDDSSLLGIGQTLVGRS